MVLAQAIFPEKIHCMSSANYAEVLRALRKRLRFTQPEMAGNLGVTRERYKNWEVGQSNPPAEIRKKIERLHLLKAP